MQAARATVRPPGQCRHAPVHVDTAHCVHANTLWTTCLTGLQILTVALAEHQLLRIEVQCYDEPAPNTGYTCADCPAGFTSNGETCADIDDCTARPCGNESAGGCADTGRESYRCGCRSAQTHAPPCSSQRLRRLNALAVAHTAAPAAQHRLRIRQRNLHGAAQL